MSALFPFILPATTDTTADLRRMDSLQAQPVYTGPIAPAAPGVSLLLTAGKDLAPWFWLLALILFFTERILASPKRLKKID